MTTTAKVTSREVSLSHGKTRYLEAGKGHPVILLHGSEITGGADDWRATIDLLSPHFRVLAPDFIGWPPSDPQDNMQAFPNLTDFVRGFQDGLGLRSSHIVGASMGGWIAGLLAYESPNRVEAVVMTGNAGFTGASNGRLANFQMPTEESMRQAIDRVAGMISESEREALVKEKLRKLNEPGYAEAHGEMMKTRAAHANRMEYNLIRRLPFFTMPTLFLFGGNDAFGGSEVTEKLKSLAPGSRVVIIEEGSHQVHIDNTEAFCKAVVKFLTGV
jgi:pimeloyl-ACP methyl ester carboxylesterase